MNNIERLIAAAQAEVNGKIPEAEMNEYHLEDKCYHLQALVMEAEADYIYNTTDINAGARLDRLYEELEQAQVEYEDAIAIRKNLHKVAELLERATWYTDID